MRALPGALFLFEHDPEKWAPVFGKRSCSSKNPERDDDSKESHPAQGEGAAKVGGVACRSLPV
jgi:hypothetical protein